MKDKNKKGEEKKTVIKVTVIQVNTILKRGKQYLIMTSCIWCTDLWVLSYYPVGKMMFEHKLLKGWMT